jgi:3',5'-cyclic AMP phosphodiesterase CpdA
VHIAVVDSDAPLDVTDSAATDDMLDWLRADLAQTQQPWKIVAHHHPAYSTSQPGSDSRVQSKLVPIYEAYGVNLVLTGHRHNYERTLPLRGGQVTTTAAGGIVYVVSGAGAAADGSCGTASWVAVSYCSQNYGLYSRISVNGNALTVEAVDAKGVVKDRYAFAPIPLLTPTPSPTKPPTPSPTKTPTPMPTSTVTALPSHFVRWIALMRR